MEAREATKYSFLSTSTAHINGIPDEMLVNILKNLNGRDLLSCRLVNFLWLSICTDLCRRKYVKLSKPGFEAFVRSPEQFSTVFYSGNLPWTFCNLDAENTKTMNSIIQFFETYGTNLLKLTLTRVSVGDFIQIFRHTSNLQELKAFPASVDFDFPTDAPRLTKLKHFESVIDSTQSVRFLEYIVLQSGAPLRSAKVDLTLLKVHHIQNACKLLSLIPRLSLQFNYNKTTRDLVNWLTSLSIISVKVNVIGENNYSRNIRNYYGPLEHFLVKYSPRLERLFVWYDPRESQFKGEIQTLKLPVLPKLTFLKVFLQTEGAYEYDPNSCSPGMMFLAPLTTNQFPSLEELVMCNKSPESLIPAFKFVRLDSVKILVLDGYHLGDQWGPIFPNMKEVFAVPILERATEYGIENIKEHEQRRMLFNLFKSMENLERFEVKFPARISCNINSAIFEALSQLLIMKGLRTMKFTLPSSPSPILDTGASQTLLLPPLDLTFARGVKITEECKQKLRAYHTSVTIVE